MRSWTLCGRVLLVAAIFPPQRGAAYSVVPSLIVLRPDGNDSSAFLQLANKTLHATAVEITVNEFSKDLDGSKVTGREADADFLVYPAQIVMLPGDEIGVQVRWIGEPVLEAERAYTLVAREIPLPRKIADEVEPAEGIKVDITVLLNYEVRIYVTPANARPQVVVESVIERPPVSGEPAGASLLEIVLANRGTAHQSLKAASLVLTPANVTGTTTSGSSVILTAREVPALVSPMLAGDRRRLLIPRPAQLPAGPVRVVLSE